MPAWSRTSSRSTRARASSGEPVRARSIASVSTDSASASRPASSSAAPSRGRSRRAGRVAGPRSGSPRARAAGARPSRRRGAARRSAAASSRAQAAAVASAPLALARRGRARRAGGRPRRGGSRSPRRCAPGDARASAPRARAARRGAASAGPGRPPRGSARARTGTRPRPASSERSERISCCWTSATRWVADLRAVALAEQLGERRRRRSCGPGPRRARAPRARPGRAGRCAPPARRGCSTAGSRRPSRLRRPRAARGRAGCPRPSPRSGRPSAGRARSGAVLSAAPAPRRPESASSTISDRFGCGADPGGAELERSRAGRGRASRIGVPAREGDEVLEQVEQRRLGPVDVVDDHHQRALGGCPLEQPADGPGASPPAGRRPRTGRSRRAPAARSGVLALEQLARRAGADRLPPSCPTISASGR